MIATNEVLILSAILFSIGLFGVLSRKNVIVILMCIEVMLNAVNLSMIAFASSLNSMEGVMFSFFVIIIAAAEAVVGLSIVLAMYRNGQSIDINNFNLLKF